MSAQVSQNEDVQLLRDGKHAGTGLGFTAWCNDPACGTYSEGFLTGMWRARTHVVPIESAPHAAALEDAWQHDQEAHGCTCDFPGFVHALPCPIRQELANVRPGGDA